MTSFDYSELLFDYTVNLFVTTELLFDYMADLFDYTVSGVVVLYRQYALFPKRTDTPVDVRLHAAYSSVHLMPGDEHATLVGKPDFDYGTPKRRNCFLHFPKRSLKPNFESFRRVP